MNLKLHPIVHLFPRMPKEEFDELVADIRAHGLRRPLLVHHGQILDGRHRWEAAEKLGIDCQTEEWDGRGSLTDLVISLNLKRRHLNQSQKGTVVVGAEKFYAEELKANQRLSQGRGKKGVAGMPPLIRGKARDHAAKKIGVSPRYVQDAKAIQKRAPERFEEIKAGKATISQVKRDLSRADRIEKLVPKSLPPSGEDRRVPLLLADPPWRYEHVVTESRAIENQYPTMSHDEIKAYPVARLATDDAVLFLWATSPKLAEALEVMATWGFTYRTSLVWVKDKIGMGYWARQRHELLLVGTRGNPPAPEPANRPDSVFSAPRGRHSEKPAIVYEILESLYPEWKDNRREVFARSKRDGWLCLGNEI